MRKDRQLAIALVRGFNQMSWGNFDRYEFPEETAGHNEAVDVIAIAASGTTLAVEHTTVLPFVGEREDTIAFAEVFSHLETDPSFRLPGFSIDVLVPVGAIPRGKKARDVRGRAKQTVSSWFLNEACRFPLGESHHNVSAIEFDLTVTIVKEDHCEGRVFLFRSGMPNTFIEIVRKAVHDKIPKLSRCAADSRVLLLEKDNLPRGYAEAARLLDRAIASLKGIKSVDEIWMVNTVGWEMGGDLWFLRIWPRGVSAKFWMRAPAGQAELAELVRAA